MPLKLFIFGGGPTWVPFADGVGPPPCLRDSCQSEGGMSPPGIGIAIGSLVVVKQSPRGCCLLMFVGCKMPCHCGVPLILGSQTTFQSSPLVVFRDIQRLTVWLSRGNQEKWVNLLLLGSKFLGLNLV